MRPGGPCEKSAPNAMVQFSVTFAMSEADFDKHKQNAYKAAVAKAAGNGVLFSDIDLFIASISSLAIYVKENPARRRLLQDDTVKCTHPASRLRIKCIHTYRNAHYISTRVLHQHSS